jgi:hypothetical protein
MDELDQMPPQWCQRLKLPLSANYAAGAAALMESLVDQTSLPWPDEFPLQTHASEKRKRMNLSLRAEMPRGRTALAPAGDHFPGRPEILTWEQLGFFTVDFIDYSRARESN